MGVLSKFTTPSGGIRNGQNITGLARGSVTTYGGMKQVHNAKWGYKEWSEYHRASKRVCNPELRIGVLTTSNSHSAGTGFKSRNKYLLP